MDIYFRDGELADLIMNPAKLKKRFGATSAKKIAQSMAVVEAAENFTDIVSLRRPAAKHCEKSTKTRFCVQVDEKHALTFAVIEPERTVSAQEVEVIRLDRRCSNFKTRKSHG